MTGDLSDGPFLHSLCGNRGLANQTNNRQSLDGDWSSAVRNLYEAYDGYTGELRQKSHQHPCLCVLLISSSVWKNEERVGDQARMNRGRPTIRTNLVSAFIRHSYSRAAREQ